MSNAAPDMRGSFSLHAVEIAAEKVTIEGTPADIEHLSRILSAAIDSDPSIRRVDEASTRLLAQKIHLLASTDTADPVRVFSLTKKELADLALITTAIASQDLEDHFPDLVAIGDARVEELDQAVWHIRDSAIPRP